MKPPFLVSAMMLLTGLLLAQEPSPQRRILKQGEVRDLRLLERAPVELPEGCTATRGEPARYEYEVLIDERGEVERALLLSEVEGISPCVMKAITKSVGYSTFSVPRDAGGEPVACTCRFTVESDLR